ncbi:hypothetical protein XFUD_12010 [Xylella fastidiosa]|uniref:hypothetical protein n=1 Tax=Xylella fastidiosa TaxID=2371 RepID=UPI00080AF1A8|nr:hypothetical protein [Xylella fastidiosa]ALQ95734.1 hypothetical protein XFUD_12010 [Xylella fastidiosa]ALR02923.1 hypothetical protein OY18_12760 [Xylella fastidiosa]MDG5826457.1 hypothetical protein [Xylella fastidiosa subsp. pauca]OCA57033.1 hypothetical protein AA93_11810 [Xylella fastidiosa subsp. pauca 11399]WGZ32072.1 hypothetical protein O4444_11505 [Xylella fastidiosa subsp. pauca]
MIVALAHRFSAVPSGTLILTIGDPSGLEAVQGEAFFFCDNTFPDGHNNLFSGWAGYLPLCDGPR